MLLVENENEYKYDGGATSLYEYVKIKRTTIEYLNGLCEKLGYMGIKSIMVCGEINERIQTVEGQFEINQVFNAHKDYEKTMCG